MMSSNILYERCPVCGRLKEAGTGVRYDTDTSNGCHVVIRASKGAFPVCDKCSLEAVEETARSILAGEVV